jgi:hypothetical protein
VGWLLVSAQGVARVRATADFRRRSVMRQSGALHAGSSDSTWWVMRSRRRDLRRCWARLLECQAILLTVSTRSLSMPGRKAHQRRQAWAICLHSLPTRSLLTPATLPRAGVAEGQVHDLLHCSVAVSAGSVRASAVHPDRAGAMPIARRHRPRALSSPSNPVW